MDDLANLATVGVSPAEPDKLCQFEFSAQFFPRIAPVILNQHRVSQP